MQCYYSINVAHRGVHFFATAEHSAVNKGQAFVLWNAIRLRFPVPEYQVTCTYWAVTGHDVDFLNGE